LAVVTLDELLDTGEARRRSGLARQQVLSAVGAGLYWTGWALFKAIRLLLVAIGGVFWVLGYAARRVVWPALVWCAAAVKLGWEDGHRTDSGAGGARVPR
jgi:hypothetical protein